MQFIVYTLMIYMPFEGALRRLLPEIHQYVLLLKDAAVISLYIAHFFQGRTKIESSDVVIKKFELGCLAIYVLYALWNLYGLLNPGPEGVFLAALLGFKTNLLYLPLIVVGIRLATRREFGLQRFISGTAWPLPIMLVYGLLQVFSGFDTVEQGMEGEYVESTGGWVRHVGDAGWILVIGSTLTSGLLSPFTLIWFVSLTSVFLSGLANRSLSTFRLGLFAVSSVLLMLLSINRTVIVSAVIALSVFIIWNYSQITRRIGRKFIFAIIVSILSTLAILQYAELVQFDYWYQMVMAIFEPHTRSAVTTELYQGVLNVLDYGGFTGIGLGFMTQGSQFVGLEPEIWRYGIYDTESVVHKMLLELGIIGAALFVVMFAGLLIFLLKLAWVLARNKLSTRVDNLCIGSFCLLLVYLILGYKHHSFTSNATLQINVFLMVGIFIGYAIKSARQESAVVQLAEKDQLQREQQIEQAIN